MTARPVVQMTAAAIAAAVNGVVRGDATATVSKIAPLDRAAAGDLSFYASTAYASLFAESTAAVVLVTAELADQPSGCACRVVVENPHEALLSLLPTFHPAPVLVPGVHPSAVVAASASIAPTARVEAMVFVGEGAVIGEGAWIGAQSYVGDGVTIGANTRLFPQVTLYGGCTLGARVTLHSGVRIGSDGFGYIFRDGAHQKVPHVGGCVIGNDVEIGANSTVDRGSIDDTMIGDGSKLDNLVHIGHNVQIGRLCLFMAQVGISGSTHIGDGVIFAGQSGAAGHLEIGAGARFAARAAVLRDVPAGETWSGMPARRHRDVLRANAALFRLADMLKQIEALVEAAQPQ